MNAFDLALVLVLLVFGTLGAIRGFVRAAFFLINWVLASAVAWIFSTPVSAALEKTVEEPVTRMLVAFALIFVVMFILGMALGRFLHSVMESVPVLKLSNRILGGLAGASVGVAVIIAAFLIAGLTSVPQNGWWRDSALAPFFESFANVARELLPADIARHIRYG